MSQKIFEQKTVKSDKPYSFVIENTWLPKGGSIFSAIVPDLGMDFGWGNGYVAIPEGHPWYKVEYDNIDASVHGGLTFSELINDMWVIGFDTAHSGDSLECGPKAPYCQKPMTY